MKNYIYTIIALNDHQEIVIHHDNRTISFFSYGVGPVVAIKHNKNAVLKANKKSVSTCDSYMMSDFLMRDKNTAAALFARYAYGINSDIKEKTISSFFSDMSVDTFGAFLEKYGLINNNTAYAAAMKKIIINYLFCTDHNAKMSGMISCSTYVKYNQFCLARRINCPGAICEHCFAYAQTENYSAQAAKLAKAHIFFTTCRIYPADVPHVDIGKFPYFRFESFGDIASPLQFENYCTIAAALDQGCTLWTKNPGIIQAAIDNGCSIPKNLRVGLSSLYVNKPEIERAKKYSFVRFVFTVYTKEYAVANNININCGARHCLSCLNCYGAHLDNYSNGKILVINELLK